MSGRIISTPSNQHACEGMPAAKKYEVGTVWECDECKARWVVRVANNEYARWNAWVRKTRGTQ
jgi:hypothetical protein